MAVAETVTGGNGAGLHALPLPRPSRAFRQYQPRDGGFSCSFRRLLCCNAVVSIQLKTHGDCQLAARYITKTNYCWLYVRTVGIPCFRCFLFLTSLEYAWKMLHYGIPWWSLPTRSGPTSKEATQQETNVHLFYNC